VTAGRIRVGCSGWSYPDWRGVVYPADLPSTKWFGWYAQRLDTVELNNTFYRLPTDAAVRHWADQAPDGFAYAAKVGSFATHRKKLKDPDIWLPRHLERIRLLAEHLGPNVFQLPPHWHRDVPRLEAVLDALPNDVRWAVELRDPTWLDDTVFEALARHDVALCIHDLLANHPFVRTTSWIYVRFHGPNAVEHPYHGLYGGQRLHHWVERLGEVAAAGGDAWCFFNNDVGGSSFRDAMWLRERVT
jgi:uncharacterized protein YecE (DUF72 family)